MEQRRIWAVGCPYFIRWYGKAAQSLLGTGAVVRFHESGDGRVRGGQIRNIRGVAHASKQRHYKHRQE